MTKQKQTTELKIDLDRDCVSPRKELIEAYTSENATDIWTDRDLKPEYRNNARIWAASRGSGNKVTKKIFALYRKRLANSKEYLIFHCQLSTKDHWGNNLSMPLELGFWDKPEISRTYSFNPNTIKTTVGAEDLKPQPSEPSLEGHETIYDHPWEKVKDQVLSWHQDGTIVDTAKFYVWTDKRYSVSSFENWLNLSIDDNILLNMAGNRFDALYRKGDAASLEKVKEIVRSELEKGILCPKTS